jgi:hypothetical protein
LINEYYVKRDGFAGFLSTEYIQDKYYFQGFISDVGYSDVLSAFIKVGKEADFSSAVNQKSYMSFGTKKSVAAVAEAMRLTSDGYIQPASRVLGKKGSDVANANDITLGDGNYFIITGTTTINRILSTGWTTGSEIILQADDSVKITHTGAMPGSGYYGVKLAGSADYDMTAGDVLKIYFDGGFWRESSRTVI